MKRSLNLILWLIFINVLGFGLILPLLPYQAVDFNASSLMVGFLLSANALTQMVGALLMIGTIGIIWTRILNFPDLDYVQEAE